MKNAVLLGFFLALAACGSLPKHAETTRDPGSFIMLWDMKGAELTVDGRFVGVADRKKSRFPVEPGMHDVQVFSGGRQIYQRDVFIEKGTTREVRSAP